MTRRREPIRCAPIAPPTFSTIAEAAAWLDDLLRERARLLRTNLLLAAAVGELDIADVDDALAIAAAMDLESRQELLCQIVARLEKGVMRPDAVLIEADALAVVARE
jgi:hypothetical protein